MIKKTILFLSVITPLILSIGLSGYASQTQEGYKRYYNHEEAFSIEFPSTWETEVKYPTQRSSMKMKVLCVRPKDAGSPLFPEIISVEVYELPYRMNTEQFYENYKSQLAKDQQAYKLEEEEKLLVDNSPAVTSVWVGWREIMSKLFEVKRLSCLIAKGNRGYHIGGISSSGQFPEYREIFGRVIGSFRFEGTEKGGSLFKSIFQPDSKVWLFVFASLAAPAFLYLILMGISGGGGSPLFSEEVEAFLTRLSIGVLFTTFLLFMHYMIQKRIFLLLIVVVWAIIVWSVIYKRLKTAYMKKYGKASSPDVWVCRKCGKENLNIDMECWKCTSRREE